MNDLTVPPEETNAEIMYSDLSDKQKLEVQLDIIDESIRRRDLSRLTEMEIVPADGFPPLEEDIIDNIRLFRVTEMVYATDEQSTDKFTTVFNTLSTYRASCFILIDSDGSKTSFYLGVRSNGDNRSTVTLSDTLKNTLIGHFPGAKIQNEDRQGIARISEKIARMQNVSSVSVIGNEKSENGRQQGQFVQGMEKLMLALQGRQYTGIILAQNRTPAEVQVLRKGYQKIYTKLSPLQKTQLQTSTSSSKSQSFFEMTPKQKAAMIAGSAVSIAGAAIGFAAGNMPGMMLGGQIGNSLGGLFSSFAPAEQSSRSDSSSTTLENKYVTDMLELLDDALGRTKEFDSYGMWNLAGYFISDDMSSAEIAASNYRSLMSGEYTGREVSAINSWRGGFPCFDNLTACLSRFTHPQFVYGGDFITSAATAVSGKELGLHLGLPRATVPGLPVIEHAQFGKEIHSGQLIAKTASDSPEDRITLGRVFDLGQVTNQPVELENRSLNMHTFITGSTGSGKSNTVYQILMELRQDRVPFLVIEPAKGEYRDVFGRLPDVRVFSTNPSIAPLIHINPFMFPDSIHVLEHVDGLVEIFCVCWPMYDAMPAFFKDAVLRAYEAVGWDLGTSGYDGDAPEYPDFEVLAEQLDYLIEHSGYHSDIKSNYKGALLTRVRSLTVGLNKYIFTNEQTPYETLFDQNCILDISRVKSGETKALIMGMAVYLLNEYRVHQKAESNCGLRHVTVLEEAHALLKNTAQGTDAGLVGKSVEMLTNTIAEIRTYGEGFVIVDQSPSSVDIAAIKNTNTKIVLRTPEANDREAVGRSMGLTDEQVNEIARLPGGVAVVYQNDWICPVLAMIDKAAVTESTYVPPALTEIRPLKTARTEIIRALMQPWIPYAGFQTSDLPLDLKALDVSRQCRNVLRTLVDDYICYGGKLAWAVADIPKLQAILIEVLGVTEDAAKNAATLRGYVAGKTSGFSEKDIEEICYILTEEAKP
ncbi:MAG: ATP-binding protein [Oscillospiraceae bacterium]|jgi:hypothetical protein|nr:ATP-binding protein [Oscillospiraceae bacterium]